MVSTAYTGLGTVEHCLARLCMASVNSAAPVQIYLHSAWEADGKCRSLLSRSSSCPEHIFGNLQERFAPWAVAEMESVVRVCCGRAAAVDELPLCAEQKKAEREAVNKRCFEKLLKYASKAIAKGAVQEKAWCYKHEAYCTIVPEKDERDLWLEGGGNTCVSWSPQGSRAGWLHPSAVPCAIWLLTCEHYSVDMLLQECSNRFPSAEAIGSVFQRPTWTVRVMEISCTDVGVPMGRARNYSFTTRDSSLTVVVDVDVQDIQAVFGRERTFTGHSFFNAPEPYVKAFLRSLALKHGAVVPEEQLLDRADECLKGAQKRLSGYAGKALDLEFYPVVDLSQNSFVRGSLSDRLPSLLRHSLIWSMEKQRPLSPVETFSAMGFPMPWHEGHSGECPWSADVLMSLPLHDAAGMIGNAMHARVLGSFLAVCMASVQQMQQ